jgi:predicted O-methyltransferase YrrM
VRSAQQVRAVRDRALDEEGVLPFSVGRVEGEALRDRVVAEGARTTLEVGLGQGVSTLFICEGLLQTGGTHFACDPYQLDRAPPTHETGYEGAGLARLEDAGVRDLVEFEAEKSQIVLPRLLAEGRRFDFAFIDGNHRFEAVFLDLAYSGRLMDEGRVVFVDDIQLPGVRKAIDFFLKNLDWSVEDEGREGAHHAWLVLRTGPTERLHRDFTQFVDF